MAHSLPFVPDETVAAAVNEEGGKANPGQRKGFLVTALRQRMAKGIRQLAEVTADHLSRYNPHVQPHISNQSGMSSIHIDRDSRMTADSMV